MKASRILIWAIHRSYLIFRGNEVALLLLLSLWYDGILGYAIPEVRQHVRPTELWQVTYNSRKRS